MAIEFQELVNPGNSDDYYGKADCFLTQIEELIGNFKRD